MKHEDLVRNLVKDGEAIKNELTAHDCHVIHMAMGIAGEAGEVLDYIKKVVMYRKEANIDHIKEEIGDLFFYIEGLCQSYGLTREEVLKANVAKLTKRYGGTTYSDQAAIARVDKA